MKLKKSIYVPIFAVFLLMTLFAGGLYLSHSKNMQDSNEDKIIITETDKESLSYEEVIRRSTHIVEAEYAGKAKTDNLDELCFKVVSIIKGDITDETIYVTAGSVEDEAEKGLSNGIIYTLFLERNVSLYWSHDRYVSKVISTKDETDINYVNKVLAENPGNAPEKFGYNFTTSDDITEIINISANVFEVEVLSVFVEGRYAPTTAFSCRVLSTMKNEPESGICEIVFFNNTVEIGGRYIVLLAETEEHSSTYVLSSKNSVYTQEEAMAVPELAELLKNAVAYTQGYDTKTDSEIYEEEQAAITNG